MDPFIVVENQCSHDKIAEVFLPVIEDAVAAYRAIFGGLLLNIRLLGSVARGEAGPNSDIDFVALTHTTPDDDQVRRVQEQELRLRHKHPFLSKVDLEVIDVGGLNDFRRFVFATDSVSLYGRDAYSLACQSWDRQKLAEMVTPDLPSIVHSYRTAVQALDIGDREHLCFYSRLIGKDTLKCLRRVALLGGGPYERNIDRIHQQLLQYMPEHQGLLDELHELYAQPAADRQRLLTALSSAAGAL
jgi:predicted nucleotidyltransferase